MTPRSRTKESVSQFQAPIEAVHTAGSEANKRGHTFNIHPPYHTIIGPARREPEWDFTTHLRSAMPARPLIRAKSLVSRYYLDRISKAPGVSPTSGGEHGDGINEPCHWNTPYLGEPSRRRGDIRLVNQSIRRVRDFERLGVVLAREVIDLDSGAANLRDGLQVTGSALERPSFHADNTVPG